MIDIPQITPLDTLLVAINKVNINSPLYRELDNLRNLVQGLPTDKYQAIGQEADRLVNALQKENVDKAIETFTNACHVILEGKHPNIMNAVLVVAATVIVAILAAMFGFALLTDPVTVVTSSSSLGLVTGALTAYGLFKESPAAAAVDRVAEAASSYPAEMASNTEIMCW